MDMAFFCRLCDEVVLVPWNAKLREKLLDGREPMLCDTCKHTRVIGADGRTEAERSQLNG